MPNTALGKVLLLNPLIVCCPYPLAEEETEAHDYLAKGLRARKQKSRASDLVCPLCTHQHQSWPPAKEAAWPVGQSGAGLCICPVPWAPHPDILPGLLSVGSSFFLAATFSPCY